MSVLIKGITAKELLDVFEWARTGANNCMIGRGVIATELPDHGRLVDVDVMERMFLKATGVSISFNGVPTVIPAERSE